MPATPPSVARAGFVVLALLTAACSSSSQGGSARPAGSEIDVKVRDFHIKAPRRIAAGSVTLHVRNLGPDTHELLLVRDDGRDLPLRPDDLTVDEDAMLARTVSTLEDDHPGTRRTWKLQLTPGRYVLVCNMSGHYLGGMHARLVVQ
jgi:uncharacterized cupredoxin-like copper-binding protein